MKRLITILLIIAFFIVSYDLSFFIFREVKKATWHEVLLKGGNILDGSGKASYQSDILIRGEKIVAVGNNLAVKPGVKVINVNGLYLLPGFIELQPGVLPQGEEQKKWLACGVTTFIGGDRGSSPLGFAAYLKRFAEEKPLANYGMLYGLSDLPLEKPDLVPSAAAEALKQGVLGFSLDLEVFPDSWQNGEDLCGLLQDISQDKKQETLLVITFPEEILFQEKLFLENLSRILPAAEKFSIALHLRNFRLRSGVSPEFITTFKKELQAAVKKGIQVSGDVNPFHLSGEPLYAWTANKRFSPDELFIAKAGAEKNLLGMSLSEVLASGNLGRLELESLGVQFERQQRGCEKEFEALPFFCYQPVYALCAQTFEDLKEPRSYLQIFEEREMAGIDSIEERVKKLTSLPAAFLGLTERGLLSPGYYADLLVVKKEKNSFILDYVFVNGKVVFAQDKFTGKSPGRFLNGSR